MRETTSHKQLHAQKAIEIYDCETRWYDTVKRQADLGRGRGRGGTIDSKEVEGENERKENGKGGGVKDNVGMR